MTQKSVGFEGFEAGTTDDIFIDALSRDLDAVDREKANAILNCKLDPSWIKQREGSGGMMLDYIEGHRVIRILNDAFGNRWSFQVVKWEIVPSQPRQLYDYNRQSRRREPVYRKQCDECGKVFHYCKGWKVDSVKCPKCGVSLDVTLGQYGEPVLEPQPPVYNVLGRLILPGFGVREQWGSKTAVGGATEQEGCFKSATTDALKKCATAFGVALQLYDKDEYTGDYSYEYNEGYNEQPQPAPQPAQRPVQPAAQPQPSAQPQRPAPQANKPRKTHFDPQLVEKMKQLKASMGITENEQLNPYVVEFSQGARTNFLQITPDIFEDFVAFLEEKANSQKAS